MMGRERLGVGTMAQGRRGQRWRHRQWIWSNAGGRGQAVNEAQAVNAGGRGQAVNEAQAVLPRAAGCPILALESH